MCVAQYKANRMPLKPNEIKRRIHAARLLRDISQKELNQLGQADGFGDVEMGRVERGELEFRPGKHLDPLCRYLRVPRWWFTEEELSFGPVDIPASPDEVSSLLAQQNELLATQSAILEEIRNEQAAMRSLASTQAAAVRQMEEAAEMLRALEPLPPVPSPETTETRRQAR
jgi:hypothetical protein